MPVINQEDLLYYGLPSIGVLGGTYALYTQYRAPYVPRVMDFMNVSYAVANSLIVTQPLPPNWKSSNRLMLEMYGTRSEVSSVNRAMDSRGIDLDDRELALFLIQSEYKIDYFNSSLDLSIEYNLFSGFNSKFRSLMSQGALMNKQDSDVLSNHRKQAAAAFLGQCSHGSLGLLKASISAGATIYGFFSRKPSTSNNLDCVKEYVEERVSEYQPKIRQFNRMQLALKELRTKIEPVEMDNDKAISIHP